MKEDVWMSKIQKACRQGVAINIVRGLGYENFRDEQLKVNIAKIKQTASI